MKKIYVILKKYVFKPVINTRLDMHYVNDLITNLIDFVAAISHAIYLDIYCYIHIHMYMN